MIENKKAYYDYEILQQYEAGIILEGWEIKPILAGKASLVGGYVRFVGRRPFIEGLSVQPLLTGPQKSDGDKLRSKELLLSRKEIDELSGKVQEKGLSIVGLKLFVSNAKIKVKIALVRGKKNYDKRETEKNRAIDIDLARSVKSQKLKQE